MGQDASVQKKNVHYQLDATVPTTLKIAQIRKTAFAGLWSTRPSESLPPHSRAKHWTVYFPERDTVYVGYGISNNKLYNDIWAYDLKMRTWEQLPIDTSSIEPRCSSTAVRVNGNIVIFGGKAGTRYFSDFHVIKLDTNTIIRPEVHGDGPAPRAGHCMAALGDKIVVFGGKNMNQLFDLWTFNCKALCWTKISDDCPGRVYPGYVCHEKSLFIIGAAKSDEVLQYNFETDELDCIVVTGNPPPPSVTGPLLACVGDYLFLFGGSCPDLQFSVLRAYDIKRHWWFLFNVMPDGSTTSIEDGKIDSLGFFMVPRTVHSSLVYHQREKELVVFLGEPEIDPIPISSINVGESLAIINLQNDMRGMVP